MNRTHIVFLMALLILAGGFVGQSPEESLHRNGLGLRLVDAILHSAPLPAPNRLFRYPCLAAAAAREAVRRHDLDLARDILAVAPEKSSIEPCVLYAEGEFALAEGDVAQAVLLWERVRALGALRELGRQFMAARDWDNAEVAYQAGVALNPGDVELLIGLARAKWYARQDMAAVELFTRVLTLDSDSLDA